MVNNFPDIKELNFDRENDVPVNTGKYEKRMTTIISYTAFHVTDPFTKQYFHKI